MMSVKEKFYKKLEERGYKHNSSLYSRKKIADLIQEIKETKILTARQGDRQIWLLKTYDVLSIDGEDNLIKAINDNLLYNLEYENKIFDDIFYSKPCLVCLYFLK